MCVYSSSSGKPTEQHIHDHVCTYHSKKQPANNTEHTWHDTAYKQHREHVTDPNNAQLPRHGVIKGTIAGSLACSWPPPLPRRRRCCVLLLLLLGLSAAVANNRCAVVASSVCECWDFRLVCVRAHVRSRTSTRSHQNGVIKRMIGGSLARGWPPPLPHHRRCCVLLLLLLASLLLLPIIVVLLLLMVCASVQTSFTPCVRARVRMELPRVS